MQNNVINFIIIFQFIIVLLLIFSIYFCLSHRHASRIYWAYCKNFTVIFIIIEIMVFLKRGSSPDIVFSIIPYHFISVLLFMMAGMILARLMNRPSLPIFFSLGRRSSPLAKQFLSKSFIHTILSALFVCVFTFLLFKLTKPEISDYFKSRVTEEGEFSIVAEVSFISILFFLLVAFYEEVVFRLFTQSFFLRLFRKARMGPFISIVLTACLFAVGHFGVLAEWHIKFTQTFVIGIVLGWLMYRHGMESSFAVHAALNIFALYASDWLL